MAGQDQYTAANITVLEGLEPVRKRPGMYIGGTGIEGLHHLIWEVVDNSIDEAMAGHADKIIISLHKDNRISVLDNGRGIPVDRHLSTGKSALETVMTVLHAGGKFGGGGYKVSGGLHGVGISVVNALSSYVRAEVYRNGKIYMQEYDAGTPRKEVAEIGQTDYRGTYVIFAADPAIFPEIKYNLKTIIDRIRQKAYLTKGITITLNDLTQHEGETDKIGEGHNSPVGKTHTFYFEGGIASYVRHLNKGKTVYNEPPFYMEKTIDDTSVEVALAYADDFNEHVYTFANTEYTIEGGTHLTGFRTALTRVINDYAKKNNLIKETNGGLTGDDVREGLTAVISIKLREPQFEGQTKGKLGNPEVRTIVESVVSEHLSAYFEENPAEARKIIEKSLLSLRARLAAKAARETVIRKGALEGMTLPGKLSDCSEKDPTKSELYIVEGDSAGGCFDGDTLIALTDQRNISFKQLIEEQGQGKRHFCYTINSQNNVTIGEIKHPRITKKNTPVVRVILDNGEEIICTPDHKFMLRDGSYKEAQQLITSDSLMPFYREESELGGNISVKIITKDLTEVLTPYNHQIVKIETLQKNIDVYDIEVPGTHNFALASGVFVHNSAKQGRDRRFQAILPLRGKVLNVERARLDRMLTSESIKNLIIALGVGVGEQRTLEKLRYGRVIIMTDADVDGAHIRTLLLTLLYRHFPELIREGHVYIAQPPLYAISKGKEKHFAYTDAERDAILDKMRVKYSAGAKAILEEAKDAISPTSESIDEEPELELVAEEAETAKKSGISGLSIQRYKGLGEMNAEQLWDTTMNPENRILLLVTEDDAAKADECFAMLMGDEVAPRKRFIQTHAKYVKNLDV